MENNASGWIAAFWALTGAAIMRCIGYIHARMTTPTDQVQAAKLREFGRDLEKLGDIVRGMDDKIATLGSDIAFLRGIQKGHDG